MVVIVMLTCCCASYRLVMRVLSKGGLVTAVTSSGREHRYGLGMASFRVGPG